MILRIFFAGIGMLLFVDAMNHGLVTGFWAQGFGWLAREPVEDLIGSAIPFDRYSYYPETDDATPALGTVLPEIQKPLQVLLGATLFFHAVLWNAMGKWWFMPYEKGIDYIWYSGALAALVLAGYELADTVGRADADQAMAEYDAIQSYSEKVVASMRTSCRTKPEPEGIAWLSLDNGQQYNFCGFYVRADEYWNGNYALCEKGIHLQTIQDTIETWTDGEYTYVLSEKTPISTCRDSQLMDYTCDNLHRISFALLGAARDSTADYPAGSRDLGPTDYFDMRQAAPWFLDAFRLCRAQDIALDRGETIARYAAFQHRFGMLEFARANWLTLFAVIIALRLIKTTSEVRTALRARIP